MYNENLKHEFLNSKVISESHKKSAISVFNRISKFEEKFHKDIYEMSESELSETMKVFVSIRAISQEPRISVIREYISWCKNNGLNTSDAIKIFEERKILMDSQVYRNISVTSPSDLQKFLDEVFDKESLETVDNTYRCLYWVAFAGCPEDNIDNLSRRDVNLEDKSFISNGVKYPIYMEGFESFRNCSTLDYFLYNHPNYKKESRIPRYDSNYLFSGVKSAQSLEIMRRILNTKNRKAISEGRTTKKISYNRILLCGVFYRTYQLELLGYKPDFSKFVESMVGDKVYKLDKTNSTQESKRRRLASDYENDYRLWKTTLLKS